MKDKFLPIGTVVLLKGGSKRIMITGYCSVEEKNPNKIYDYNGCIFPEGYLKSDQICLFNHDQIIRVDHVGLTDEEQTNFLQWLLEFRAATLQNEIEQLDI
ncbi:MAG: DUF4176 domain-containing protein [Bacilli bacterium]|jgi:hypothetical protein|nr:DUF4176 domain-containing protein [Bacilli bacterium]